MEASLQQNNISTSKTDAVQMNRNDRVVADFVRTFQRNYILNIINHTTIYNIQQFITIRKNSKRITSIFFCKIY